MTNDEINTASQGITDIMTKLVTIVENYAPQAVELGHSLGYIAALQHLITGFAFLFLVIAIIITYVLLPKSKVFKNLKPDDKLMAWGSMGLVGGLFIIIFSVSVFTHLFNIYAWASLSDPKIWLAAKSLGWVQ